MKRKNGIDQVWAKEDVCESCGEEDDDDNEEDWRGRRRRERSQRMKEFHEMECDLSKICDQLQPVHIGSK